MMSWIPIKSYFTYYNNEIVKKHFKRGMNTITFRLIYLVSNHLQVMLIICSVLLNVLFILDLFSNLMLPLTYVFAYQAIALPFFNAGAKIG